MLKSAWSSLPFDSWNMNGLCSGISLCGSCCPCRREYLLARGKVSSVNLQYRLLLLRLSALAAIFRVLSCTESMPEESMLLSLPSLSKYQHDDLCMPAMVNGI